MNIKENYIKTIYSEKSKPFTKYPNKLINYLIKTYNIKKESKVLDLCCGRGEFINEFINFGCEGFAVDIDNICLKYFPKIIYKECDLVKDKLPFNDDNFDVVFSKSTIEHFHNPENMLSESYRVLKPGGFIITLTPSWTHNIKNFYDDFTHVQPYSKVSLKEAHEMMNFIEVKSRNFTQLPVLWKKNLFSKFMLLVSLLARCLAPNYLKKKSKFIFYSKEVMLICTGKK